MEEERTKPTVGSAPLPTTLWETAPPGLSPLLAKPPAALGVREH